MLWPWRLQSHMKNTVNGTGSTQPNHKNDVSPRRWWVCRSLCASQQKQMQVRWGFWSPRTEHKHYDRRRTGSKIIGMRCTARYESTLTARWVYDVWDTSRGHYLYVPRTKLNGLYQKEERKRERVVDGKWTGFERNNWEVMEGSPMVSGDSWFASRRWTAVRARGQDWLRYETERDSTKDFVREENGVTPGGR